MVKRLNVIDNSQRTIEFVAIDEFIITYLNS